MRKKNIIVLGGGITGLTSAYVLCKKGFNVTLIEKKDFVGGLAATFSHKGYLLDYGPHNFHTHIPGVLNFVRDELQVPLTRLPLVASKLYFMGKFLDYPLKITNAIRDLSWTLSAKCLLGYILSRINLKFKRNYIDDSFESWVKSRFGRYVYDLYFGPYVKKVWGISGSELDASVARKRIPEPSLFSLIVRTVTGLKSGKGHSEDPASIESYYPPKGIGVIADKLRDFILANGGKIELNCNIDSIVTEQNGCNSKYIYYATGGSKKRLEWDYLISTIPINEFFFMLHAPGVEKLYNDIGSISYRSIILLYMFLSQGKVFDAPWIYFNEKDNPNLIFNRLYEVGNFSREMIHENNGSICLEISCSKGDELWKKSDEELFKTCMTYLEKNNFLSREKVKYILTKRLEVAYPIFKVGYHARLKNPLRFLINRGDIACIGRQGLFSYANIDHCIDMGLKVEELLSESANPKDFYRIYKNYLF